MAKKYIAVRMPIKAYQNFMDKKFKMEGVISQVIRRKMNIPLTKVFMAVSENPIEIDDEYMLKLTRRRKKKNE